MILLALLAIFFFVKYSNLSNPFCYVINGDDKIIKKMACNELDVKKEIDAIKDTYNYSDLIPEGDFKVKGFVIIGSYRRGGFALIYEFLSKEKCICVDGFTFQSGTTYDRSCKFISEYFSGDDRFISCLNLIS